MVNESIFGRYASMVIVMAAAVILLGGSETVKAASFLNNCTTNCHGMPPRDAARKANPHFNSMSSAFSGNHQTHLSAVPAAADCSACHTPVSSTNFGHQNDIIEMQTNIHNSPANGQYKVAGAAIVFKNQTSIPVLGSCSSVNCHFENQTPVWGTSAASTNCATCHNASPVTFAHPQHTAVTVCETCHSDHAIEAKPFAHATSAGRAITVTVGSYAGSNNNYLPSQTGRVTGSCTTSYCHSSGQSSTGAGPGISVTTPLWSNTASLNCGSCHKNMGSDTTATGSHVKHAQNAKIACATCHAGYTETAVASPTHVNKNIDLGFSGAATGTTYGKGTGYPAGSGVYATCSTSYCHSNGQSSTGSGSAPAWGGAVLGCGSCHVDMSSNASATGSHIKHVQIYAISCDVCHGTGYSASSVVYPQHVNKSVNLASSIVYSKGASFLPGAAYGSCSTASCHSNGQSLAWLE